MVASEVTNTVYKKKVMKARNKQELTTNNQETRQSNLKHAQRLPYFFFIKSSCLDKQCGWSFIASKQSIFARKFQEKKL